MPVDPEDVNVRSGTQFSRRRLSGFGHNMLQRDQASAIRYTAKMGGQRPLPISVAVGTLRN
jgi:hypothetical protein